VAVVTCEGRNEDLQKALEKAFTELNELKSERSAKLWHFLFRIVSFNVTDYSNA